MWFSVRPSRRSRMSSVGSRTGGVRRPSYAGVAARRIVVAVRDGAVRLRLQADQPAGATLRIALLLDSPTHGRSPCAGRQKFFPKASRRVATSSIASARSFLSLRFSSSRAFRRRASETSMPP